MLAEFSVVPIGAGEHLSPYVAECVKIVKDSGLKYELVATGTIVEGDYDQVMQTVGQCHKKVRSMTNRVITSVRIDDWGKTGDEMERKVKSVEEKVR